MTNDLLIGGDDGVLPVGIQNTGAINLTATTGKIDMDPVDADGLVATTGVITLTAAGGIGTDLIPVLVDYATGGTNCVNV